MLIEPVNLQLMDKQLAELRAKWATEDWPDIVHTMQHRMGINTGDMVTGIWDRYDGLITL